MTSTLREVLDALARAKIDYALIGAGAMAARGVPRSTLDTDLLVLNRRVLTRELWTEAGLTPPVAISLGDDIDPLDGVVRVDAPEGEIEIIVPKGEWARQALAEATLARYLSLDVRVVQVADLVILKLMAGGYRDRVDIALLIEALPDERVVSDVDARISNLDEQATTLWSDLSADFRVR